MAYKLMKGLAFAQAGPADRGSMNSGPDQLLMLMLTLLDNLLENRRSSKDYRPR